MHQGSSFFEIAAILLVATILGMVGQKLRQPLLIMFLAAGILVGPAGFALVESHEQIELLAQMGIALLLFVVGLKLDIQLIRSTGPVALATGLGQIIFTSAIGFGIAMAFDMTVISGAYVAVALTFSSTIIIVKLLSDKKEIDSLHGQIALGFLIVQDIAAILALVALTTFGTPAGEDASVLFSSMIIFGKGIGFLAIVAVMMKWVLPGLTRRLSYSQEMLTLFAVAWAVALGAASELLGFSKEVGAFVAGVSLASTDFRDTIGSRLSSLRDFLLLFFFIDLGARLDWNAVGSQIGGSVVFSLFVLIGNPVIVLIIMGLMGYRRRTAFLAGLTVAQISEFSLIVAALGLSLGHINDETMGLITLVGVVTIFASTYMILYSGTLYRWLSEPLKVFERNDPYREAEMDDYDDTPELEAIMFGLGNYGSGLAEYLQQRRKSFVAVDFDPETLKRWRARGIPVHYGDIADPELHEQLPLDKTRWVISTIRSRELNFAFMELLRNRQYPGKIAVAASTEEEASLYEQSGVDLVLKPFIDAAEQAVDALSYAMDVLPHDVHWPVSFLEVRIRSDAAFAGHTLKEIPLRSTTGVSVLAVSRAGRLDYDPGPDFRIHPGDRLIIVGPPAGLREAEMMLNQMQLSEEAATANRFEIAEIRIADDSALAGKTFDTLRIRQQYGVTVVGIQRGSEKITKVRPTDSIAAGDCLIVIGASAAIKAVRTSAPL